MKILLTNDDGYNSQGILALHAALIKEHEVFIVAPSRERSACSHSITLVQPVQFKEIDKNHIACSGTPADCVLYSLLGGISFKPDCIISGINRGPNLGTDILYSGTAAAARQGALASIPSIAISSSHLREPFNFNREAQYIASTLPTLLDLIEKRTFININFPSDFNDDSRLVNSFPSIRHYSDSLNLTKAADGSSYLFLDGLPIASRAQKGSDWSEIQEGNISFSIVKIDPESIEKKKL